MAYRRSYGRRYRRRAVSRVRTVTGKSASFVKLPSYKNMAYRGNERSGVLHEIKFVKQIPLNFEVTSESDYNYAFLYIDCMAELINSQDFLKYASQFQDYCPYAVTVSAACPVSLVGNSLLTNRLYDWPYFSTTPGREFNNFNNMSLGNAQLGQYLINAGQFYPVGQLPQSADYPITLETFDSFFASHSTSKKLWNANIPYGVRYARYYATSAQKAQIKNILQDSIVRYDYNDLPDIIAANVQSDVGSVNLLFRNSNGNIICMGNPVRKSVEIWGRDSNMNQAQIYPVRQNDIDSDTQTRNFAIYSYLWSLQRSRQGQFNPFYYVGVNLNQTHLSSDNVAKQVLTLTFKFYVYFKNEITDFFQGVTGAGQSGTGQTTYTATVAIVDVQGKQSNQLTLQQATLLQRGIQNFRANRMLLKYTTNNETSQLIQLTIPQILREGLQLTEDGNHLLAVLRDDPTLFAVNRNGFVIDESCYDPSTGKYTFQGYLDLLPNGGSSTLYMNKFEPDATTTDGKFITNYGQDAVSSSLTSTFQEYNATYSYPQWSKTVSFSDYADTYTSPISSYCSFNPNSLIYSDGFANPVFADDKLVNYFQYLTSTLNTTMHYTQTVSNIYNLDPVLYAMINGSHLRVINPFKFLLRFPGSQTATIIQQIIRCQYVGDSSIGNYQFAFNEQQLNGISSGLIMEFHNTYLGGDSEAQNLADLSTCLDFGSEFLSADDFDTSIIFINWCLPLGSYTTWNYTDTLVSTSFDDSGTPNSNPMHSLTTCMTCRIPGNEFTNGQIAVFYEFVKDFVYQGQNYLAASLYSGYDPSTVDLSNEDFYTAFIQESSYTSVSRQGWYYDTLNYPLALSQAQASFVINMPNTVKINWKKVKGFLQKAWSALKVIGPGIIKIVGGTIASAAIPGGASVGSAMIVKGVEELVTGVTTLVVSGKKKESHYLDGKLVSITRSNSTGLVKVIMTPGICSLSSAEPVDLDSPQFVDLDSYQVNSIDIGDYTLSRATSISLAHPISNLKSVKVVNESGEQVDASFYQARMKVQVYMDKPSEDFVLPPTFIGVTCDTQATSKNSFY